MVVCLLCYEGSIVQILNNLCSVYVLFFVNNTVGRPEENKPGYRNAYLLGGCLSGSMMRKII